MSRLEKYQLGMLPVPDRVEHALGMGVVSGEFPGITGATQVFAAWGSYSDRVIRSESGLVMVACTTDMPGVTPQMIDWWFGWHLPESRRYRLWHPLAHVRSRVREDRSHAVEDRGKYIGNVSSVDEYIGRKLMRLDISFLDPAEVGLAHVSTRGDTAVCAQTTDRVLKGDGGHLVHLVQKTHGGSEMRSVFWLGNLHLRWPVVGRLLWPVLNTAAVRRLFVSDHMALDLLRHCSEEMNHLARFLPELYADQGAGSALVTA